MSPSSPGAGLSIGGASISASCPSIIIIRRLPVTTDHGREGPLVAATPQAPATMPTDTLSSAISDAPQQTTPWDERRGGLVIVTSKILLLLIRAAYTPPVG